MSSSKYLLLSVRGAAIWTLAQSGRKEESLIELLKKNLADGIYAVSWKCINLYAIRVLQIQELNQDVFAYRSHSFPVKLAIGEDYSQQMEATRTLLKNGHTFAPLDIEENDLFFFDEWAVCLPEEQRLEAMKILLAHPEGCLWEGAVYSCIKGAQKAFLDAVLDVFANFPFLSNDKQSKIINVFRKFSHYPLVSPQNKPTPASYQEVGQYIRPALLEIAQKKHQRLKEQIEKFLHTQSDGITQKENEAVEYEEPSIRLEPIKKDQTLSQKQILDLVCQGERSMLPFVRQIAWERGEAAYSAFIQTLLAVHGDYESLPHFLENLWKEDVSLRNNRYVAVEALAIIGSGIMLRWFQKDDEERM